MDAYLLAMLVRIYASGLEEEDELKRDRLLPPSVLTTENLHMVAILYAFYQHRIEDMGIRNIEDMLKMIKSSEDECVADWLETNDAAIRKAEAELLEFVDTPATAGFRCFG